MNYIIKHIKKAQEFLEEAKTLAEEDTPNTNVLYSLLIEAMYNIKKVSKEIDLTWEKQKK